MSKILIIGGHGKVAMRAHELLHQAGHEVTAWIRSEDQSQEVRDAGARPEVFDIESGSTQDMAQRMEGMDVVVFSAGAGGGNPERTYAVDRDAAIRSIDAAQKAGVSRYLMVSYLGAGLDHGLAETDSFYPYAQSKAEADEHLRSSSLDWTILGPGKLTSEEAGGITLVGAGDSPESTDTARATVASVLAAAVDATGLAGRTVGFVNGSTPVAEALGEV